MIIPERMSVYINSLDVGNGAFLDELEQEALRDDVPIIRQDMQSFLKVLLAMHQPKQILEVGTAVGFSALLMAANTEMCHITTIEKYEKRIPVAKENFQIRYGTSNHAAGRRCTCNHAGADRDIRYDIYGCSKGAVYSFSAGCAAASAHRRYSDFR